MLIVRPVVFIYNILIIYLELEVINFIREYRCFIISIRLLEANNICMIAHKLFETCVYINWENFITLDVLVHRYRELYKPRVYK